MSLNPLIGRLLDHIEVSLSETHATRRELEDAYEHGFYENNGSHVAEERLGQQLAATKQLIEMALDLANLDSSARTLRKQWRSHTQNGLDRVEYLTDEMFVLSKPLQYLDSLFSGLRATFGGGGLSMLEMSIFERLLRSTAVLVHRRNVVPTKEQDVQEVMRDYIGAYFDDYVVPHIQGCPVKGFKADGGVAHLRAAVEFKYATTKDEVKTSVSGIFEDVAGYSGSADWTHFFAVIYQTDAFFPEGPVTKSIERVGGASWTPIIVTGRGT